MARQKPLRKRRSTSKWIIRWKLDHYAADYDMAIGKPITRAEMNHGSI
jgi:hypothetical protein